MRQLGRALVLLGRFWRPILLFEICWKLCTIAVIAPACGGLLQIAIRAAGLHYLTNSNLLQFLRSPWTILLLLLLLMLVALYTLFEIAAVCCCFSQPKKQKLRLTLRAMTRAGLGSMGAFFRGGGPLLVLHLLVLIPMMQFSFTSGLFTAMGIPDFLAYYLTREEFLLPIYLGVMLLCNLLSVRWIFAAVVFTQRKCSYRSARRTSVSLVKGRFWRTFFSVLLWNFCLFLVMLLLLSLVTVVVLLLFRGAQSRALITAHAAQMLKVLIQIILWGFSFFATPFCMAHITALLEKRCAACPQVALPEEKRRSARSTRPFHRAVSILTAICFTVAALGLHISYLVALFTGRSAFSLTFFQDPAIMAHRGYSMHAPENTLYAFSDAIDAGADCIELDVQQTKDGVLVVLHDTNLRRTTGLNRNIWEVTYDEIAELDAGSWFDPAYANARIPTLEDTLAFINRRAEVNIEIKPTSYSTDTLEQDVAALIEDYDYEDHCWVTSFSYGSLRKIKEANPHIRTGYVMSVAYGQFYNLQYADAFSLNKVFVTSQVVNYAHQYGKQVFAWTVNSVSEVRSLTNLHVDSIITDDPIMAQQVISRDSTTDTLRKAIDFLIP